MSLLKEYWIELNAYKGFAAIYEETVDGLAQNAIRVYDANQIDVETDYYKELELRYNQLLEETSTKEVIKLTSALNRIGILILSEHAYTSEFTEQVRAIVMEALKP